MRMIMENRWIMAWKYERDMYETCLYRKPPAWGL